MPLALPHETHVIARATFGWSPETGNDVLASGWEAWLDRQLDPGTIPDPEIEAMLTGYERLGASNAENYAFAKNNDGGKKRITGELHHATLLRACYSRRQLQEVMVHFWADHFNIWLEDHWLRHFHVVDHREVARADPFGRFVDLLSASAHSPGMLVYLDNYISNANDPAGVNENYGRELLELHTMGILDGLQPFSEDDMVGVAKVLSGWSVDTAQTAQVFTFKSWRHHTGPVALLDGSWSTPGRSGDAGYQDGVSLLDHLARHPSTARHLAFKLCRRFVSDDPPPSLVDSATAVYQANDTAIGPVVRHIFSSPEFAAAAGAKVRRGFEVFAAYVRSTGAAIDPDPVGEASHSLHGDGWGWLSRLGARSFSHPAPDGPADTAVDWISSDGMLRRWDTAGALLGGWQEGLDLDLGALVRPAPATVSEWITQVAARILGRVAADPPHGFSDVPAWVDDAVRWIVANRHASGYRDRTYRPDDSITRAEITRMLYRIAGSPDVRGLPDHGFDDVPAWIDDAVRWIVANRHASGYRDRTYRPDDSITRAEITRMLYRIAGSPDVRGLPDHGFDDVPAWIDDAVRWIVANGFATGYRDRTYRPDEDITRAAVTRMLYRIHAEPFDPLDATQRAALLAVFSDVPASGGDPVPEWLVDWKAHDLVTLLLSMPGFQRR